MARVTRAQAGQAADDYLALKAAQANLAKREEELKSVMLAFGNPEIEGEVARVTISHVDGRATVDMDKLKAVLPPLVLQSLMKPGKASVRFNCRARVIK